MKKRRILLFAACAMMAAGILSGCASEEMKAARSAFDAEVERIEAEAVERDAAVAAAEEYLAEKPRPLDESLIPALENAASKAKATEVDIPGMPSDIEGIDAETKKLKKVGYAESSKAVEEAKAAVSKSVKQRKLVTAPTEEFVIERLGRVSDIDKISAVTEDNDPNGQLNKAGGYTAQVYFTSPMVDQSEVYGTSVIDKGTDAGGSVEVYTTVEDAEKRNEYLAAFDGGILASGSHVVIGTVVVRTSNYLTASQQKALETDIVSALTALPKE